jgi:hypothetical protein
MSPQSMDEKTNCKYFHEINRGGKLLETFVQITQFDPFEKCFSQIGPFDLEYVSRRVYL